MDSQSISKQFKAVANLFELSMAEIVTTFKPPCTEMLFQVLSFCISDMKIIKMCVSFKPVLIEPTLYVSVLLAQIFVLVFIFLVETHLYLRGGFV